MDPTEVTVAVKAQQTIVASLEAHDDHGVLANVTVDVGASPTNLQTRKTFDDVPFRLDGKFGPVELARLPVVVGEGRQARRLRGTVDATCRGTGLAAGADAHVRQARSAHLAAGETPLGKAELTLDYREAHTRLRSALATINGGTLELEASTDLDLSYPAFRRGLKASAAPFQAQAVARKFDLAFLTGFTTALHKVGGTLEMDARASGTRGPAAGAGQARVEGRGHRARGIRPVQAGAPARQRDQRPHLGRRSRGTHRLRLAEAERARDAGRALWTLKASAEANAFPVFTDDQLVATVTLRTQAVGTARAGSVELSKVQIPEAHVELPTQTRRDLQNLRRPDDIVLLKNGKPLDPKRAKALLVKDRGAEAAMGGSGPPEESKPLQIVAVLDAPRNLWVKGQDLNVELGLSQDFRIETGEETELFGEVRIIRGRLDVLGRRFDFQRNSVVRFAGNPTEPALNVTALYNNVKAGVKVSMQVQGEAGSITLVPSSEPPLTESEIYTLLATGRTTLKRGSGGSEIGSAQAVSVLGSLAAAQLKGAVNDKVGLDVLSIEAGDSGTLQGATLEAGKYVTDDVYLGYVGKVGADPTRYENANAFRLEYQFLPRWSFEAVYGDAKSGSADIVWSRDY